MSSCLCPFFIQRATEMVDPGDVSIESHLFSDLHHARIKELEGFRARIEALAAIWEAQVGRTDDASEFARRLREVLNGDRTEGAP